MENREYPLLFIDYTITVAVPGVIMFDSEINPDHLCVKDGDIFKVIIKDGRICFHGVSRKNQNDDGIQQSNTSGSGI
jgi:hypothetical protein